MKSDSTLSFYFRFQSTPLISTLNKIFKRHKEKCEILKFLSSFFPTFPIFRKKGTTHVDTMQLKNVATSYFSLPVCQLFCFRKTDLKSFFFFFSDEHFQCSSNAHFRLLTLKIKCVTLKIKSSTLSFYMLRHSSVLFSIGKHIGRKCGKHNFPIFLKLPSKN